MCRRLFCFVALISIFGVVAPVMGLDDPSLMGWWTFDGHVRDISGNDRHGTLHGSPQFVPGVFGEALHFEANPDYVTIDGYKGVLGTNPYSIACWVKTTNTAQQQIMHWAPILTAKEWNSGSKITGCESPVVAVTFRVTPT